MLQEVSHITYLKHNATNSFISGDTKSYVYGLIALGFDGVILEGIEESYRFFEGGGEQEEEEPAPPPPAQAPAATAQ